jgi:hypothetical protein
MGKYGQYILSLAPTKLNDSTGRTEQWLAGGFDGGGWM